MAEPRRQASLGDYLVREGIISQSQFNKALDVQTKTMRSIGRILVDMDLISESMRMTVLRKQFGFEVASLKGVVVDPMVLLSIPYSFAEKHRVVPLSVENNTTLVVAMEDPSDLLVIDAVKNQAGLRVRAVVASLDDVQQILNQYQTGSEDQPILTSPPIIRRSVLYRIAKSSGFYVLAFVPLFAFMAALYLDLWKLQNMLTTLGSWNLFLYFALTWGLWTIILFEINGLIFSSDEQTPE